MIARETKVFKRPLLSLILSGKRTLKENKVAPLCQALGMTKQENLFTQSLVQFNQNTNPNRTSQYLAEILSRRPTKPSLDGDREILLTKWYYIPLLEFMKLPDFKADPKWIEIRFRKKISCSEINEALQLFQKINLVSFADGQWTMNEKTLLSSQDIPSKAIQSYHFNLLEVSKSALQEVSVDEREFLGVTFPVSKSEIQEIKNELRKLCQKMILNRSSETHSEEVASLNIQFYLMTKKSGE